MGPKEYANWLVELSKQTGERTGNQHFRLGPEFLERGRLFRAEEVDWFTSMRMAQASTAVEGQCYLNSQALAIGNSKVEYWEGYATPASTNVPVEHAWCTIEGVVIDLTWALLNRTDVEYFGVRVDWEFIADYWLEHGSAGPLRWHWLIRQGGSGTDPAKKDQAVIPAHL